MRALQVLESAEVLEIRGSPERERSCEMAQTRALIMGYQGDWQAAAEASSRAAELARDAGLAHQMVRSLVVEGAALLRLENLARAFDVLRAARETAAEIGSARLGSVTRRG